MCSSDLFVAVLARPARTLTLQARGERGRDSGGILKTMPPIDEFLAWYDIRAARGVDAVTVTPTSAAPTAAMVANGITTRNGTAGGLNRRATLIENNGVIFDAIGTYLSGSYSTAGVRGPDGTAGVASSTLAINDPRFYPRWANAGGSGSFRVQDLHNYTLTADWQPTRSLALNVARHYQWTVLTKIGRAHV